MPKESRSRMQKWPSSTLCPPNSTVTGTTHFYPVAIRSAHVICAQALTFTVKNTSVRAGAEIAEAYVELPQAAGEPFKRLVAWDKVQLAPGEARTVTLALDPHY